MNKIYTKFDETAAPLIKKMAEERGMRYYKSNFWILRNTSVIDACADIGISNRTYSKENWQEVQLHEFISALAEIPVEQKEIIISILPWNVLIKGDKVDIGCRKDVRKAELIDFIESFDDGQGNSQVWGIDVYPGRKGFMAESSFVSWETWDKFKKELKKNQIIP